MRQPVEDKVVTISRAKGSLTFPANFTLITVMTLLLRILWQFPKALHLFGLWTRRSETACAPATVTKYQKRISGPMLDHIDIHVEVPRMDCAKLSSDRLSENSVSVRGWV
jgi:magnesium chelatase family protein